MRSHVVPLARHRFQQAHRVATIDFRRTLGGRRGFSLFLLAGLPVVLAIVRAVVLPDGLRADHGRMESELANVFYVLQLRFIVYFGCAFLFVKSFRGEILDRSLHFTLLAPVRRDVLTVGKYLGALASTWALLLPSTVALVMAFFWSLGLDRGLSALISGRGFAHLAAYLIVTALACIGYGALFFLAGLFFRHPMVPAAAYLGFEFIAPYMPSALRLFSVAQHLRALLPVSISLGPLTAVSSPAPAPVAVFLLLIVALLAVALAAWRVRRLEVDY